MGVSTIRPHKPGEILVLASVRKVINSSAYVGEKNNIPLPPPSRFSRDEMENSPGGRLSGGLSEGYPPPPWHDFTMWEKQNNKYL
jgi:hypothetical protein